jgi:hypothetical protein
MTQREIDEAVASATGENVMLIKELGFGIADPLDVGFDPERRPMTFDWDTMTADEWPGSSNLES